MKKRITLIILISLLSIATSCKRTTVTVQTTTTTETTVITASTTTTTTTTAHNPITTTSSTITSTSTTTASTTTTTTINIADKYMPFSSKKNKPQKTEFNYENHSSGTFNGYLTFYSIIYESTLYQNDKPVFIMILEDPSHEKSYLTYNTDKTVFLQQMEQINLTVYASHGKELFNSMDDFMNQFRNNTKYSNREYGPYSTKRGSFTQLRQKGFNNLY